jgi:hypothetical protein
MTLNCVAVILKEEKPQRYAEKEENKKVLEQARAKKNTIPRCIQIQVFINSKTRGRLILKLSWPRMLP